MEPQGRKHLRVLLALGYYDQHLHQGVANYARQAGWLLDATMAHHGQIPSNWKGDGIITLVFPHQQDILEVIQNSEVPCVTLNAGQVPNLSGVRLNHELAGTMIADYFLAKGLEHLCFFKCSDVVDIRGRLAGFQKQAKTVNVPCQVIDWCAHQQQTGSQHDTMYQWLVEQMSLLPRPIGILSQSDKRAALLCAACEDLGLRIPQDVQIVGVDNDELTCEACPVPLSSLETNRIRLAWEGAALLDRMMNGEVPPERPQLIDPLGVVTRQSSDTARTLDPMIAQAVQFIDDHFCEPINAEKVARSVPISRCDLYATFKSHTGRSIAQQIQYLRIQKACHLLIHTTDKLHHIARQCGFSSHEHFSRSFVRVCVQTPSAYRDMHRTVDH